MNRGLGNVKDFVDKAQETRCKVQDWISKFKRNTKTLMDLEIGSYTYFLCLVPWLLVPRFLSNIFNRYNRRFKLHLVEFMIKSMFFHQLFMCTHFLNLTFIKHHDFLCLADCG